MEDGVPAVLVVEEDLRLALGPAPTLLQLMVVKAVRERLRILKLVTNDRAQVKNILLGDKNLLTNIDDGPIISVETLNFYPAIEVHQNKTRQGFSLQSRKYNCKLWGVD